MVSMASKMRTEECPLDLASLRSSVTFVGAVFVKQWGGSQIGGGEEWEVMKQPQGVDTSLRRSLAVKSRREAARMLSKCRNVPSRFEKLRQPSLQCYLAAWMGGEGSLGENGYIICMAESICCSPETITLLIGYTLIQNKTLKQKHPTV